MARPRSISDERILTVTRELVLEHGPQVSTECIARAVGVSQPALFKRFGTKKALLLAALAVSAPPAWVQLLDNGPSDEPFSDQLTGLLYAASQFFERLMPTLAALHSAGIDPGQHLKGSSTECPAPPALAIRAVTAWLERCHARGLIRHARFDSIAATLLGAVELPNVVAHLTGDWFLETTRNQHIAATVDLVANALEKPND
jgi:AcrR family transcriptional regulator